MLYGDVLIRKLGAGSSAEMTIVDPYYEAYDTRYLDLNDKKIKFRVAGWSADNQEVFAERILTQDDIIQISDFEMGGVYGVSRLVYAMPLIRLWTQANEKVRNTFTTGSDTSTVVFSDDEDPDAQKVLLDILKKARQSADKIAIVSGVTGVDTAKGITPADADLRELRMNLAREIGACFGINGANLGLIGGEKFSNVTANDIGLYRKAIAPMMSTICDALSYGWQEEIYCDLEPMLSGDIATQVDIKLKKLSYMTVNEVREECNLEPIEGGDDIKGAAAPPAPSGDPEQPRKDEMPSDDGTASESKEVEELPQNN